MSEAAETLPPVLRDVPGQEGATAFLARAVRQPHHAYLFSGPEGSGKRLGARAYAAALLCPKGGCGDCRDCRLALGERHPNLSVLEPTGPDILVGKDASDPNTARGFARIAHLTPPEPGRKVMVVLQADRLRTEAADVLLKVLEEPPGDTVFVLLSARVDDLPETIRSRCQEISFPPLAESFVVDTLAREGVGTDRARLASRLSGGNVGRARRIAADEQGLAFRDAALAAAERARVGPGGALGAAEDLAAAAKGFRERLGGELEEELKPFLDERGRPEEAFKGVVRRLQERHERRLRRAEREFLDWSLLALAGAYRDVVLVRSGASPDLLVNLDRPAMVVGDGPSASAAALAMGAVEEARADLADETNLNARLVLERLFLRLSALEATPA
ncbi:MAG TPA: DNA polymerase III subunit [Actinomycetota bacterium]